MNINVIVTAVLAVVIVVFIFVRQIIQRPVTQQSLLLPLILSVALGGLFLVGHPAPEGIAAVVIGGGSLNGGAGTVLGTTVGAFIMSLLNNGCNLLGISPFIQQILIGGIIVLAVAVDELRRRRLE